MLPRTEIFITSSVFEDKFKIKLMQFFSCLFHVTSVTPIFSIPILMCTNMTTILSHQEDLGPSVLDVKYEGLGDTGLVTTPLTMAPNLSECNVSHSVKNQINRSNSFLSYLRGQTNTQTDK